MSVPYDLPPLSWCLVKRCRRVWADSWYWLASDSLLSFDRFHSVSHSVYLHGWSAPTPGKHTLPNVVRPSCYEVLSAYVEPTKSFLDGSLCLVGRWQMSISWMQRTASLTTFRRMWVGAIPPVHKSRVLG